MATITYIKERKQSPSAMKGLIGYCLRQEKVYDPVSDRRLASGVNCNGENAFTEFMVTKRAYRKTDGINFYQYVQSFSPHEDITSAQAHEIALEFAARAWPGHEVLVTTHCDAQHPHSHFVINSVNFENGYKLRQSPSTLKSLRQLSDEICAAHGLSVLKPYEKDGAKISTREYRAAAKGESWKFHLIVAINQAMERCGSREDFLEEMQHRGYEVRWTDERKYITFTCPNGMKCRDIRLHDDKYRKENLEFEFSIRQQITEELRGGDAHPTEHRGHRGAGADPLRANRLRDPHRAARRGTEPAEGRSAVPADAVSADLSAGHPAGAKELRVGDPGDRGEVYGADRPLSDHGERENSWRDAVSHPTGWEESREVYLAMLQGGGRRQSRSRRYHQKASLEDRRHHDRHVSNVGRAVDLGLRGLLEVSRVIETEDEDEEERRKRIEAQENGDNLGTVIGLVAGLVLNVNEQLEEKIDVGPVMD